MRLYKWAPYSGMSVITLTAGCKINLGLRVTGRRADGYHELDSLFWPLSMPCDQLEIRPRPEPGLSVSCSHEAVDVMHNTLTRAYKAFCKAYGEPADVPGLDLHLIKGIPPGSGLGGGSSDAASLLLWLNSQVPAPLPSGRLTDLAVSVGADTPFFLYSSPCIVQGIGEKLIPVKAHIQDLWLVLVYPGIHVSTAWAFAELDSYYIDGYRPQNDLTKNVQGANGIFLSGAAIVARMHNDLEKAVFPRHPQLAVIKTELLHMGADAAVMSGSGSSMVGLFTAKRSADEACSILGRTYGRVWCLPLTDTGM